MPAIDADLLAQDPKMNFSRRFGRSSAMGLIVVIAFLALPAAAQDPLPSWNDTGPKKAIIEFVARVTKPGTPDFVPVSQRIATFDNDGTLWAEQPIYFQFEFAIDRIRLQSAGHPEWKTKEPFASLLEGDIPRALARGEQDVVDALATTHAGMTTEAFERIAREWVRTKRDARFKRTYISLVYQPMIELLNYLRANGFKTFIVSGGGVEFIRAFAEEAYGIPPDQVVGSSGRLKYQMRGDVPELLKLPAVDFVNDKDGKVVGIQKFIGRRPIAAFGNSDGDQQMLEWTAAGQGPHLAVLVHHTDAAREWAYDRDSRIGTLDKAWDKAIEKKWTVVSMKDDWNTIFPKQ
jgi:phosphoglycolate phosphatase-like HAD superfamily hydrolase